MIIVGIGSNLPHPPARSSLQVCRNALEELERRSVSIVKQSRWYRSAPVPASDQPDFVNGVAVVGSTLGPVELLELLHDIEDSFGRRRTTRNAARTLDLDLIAYGDLVRSQRPVLPHPRLTERAFVLLPMREIAPDWSLGGTGIEQLITNLPEGQDCEPLPG